MTLNHMLRLNPQSYKRMTFLSLIGSVFAFMLFFNFLTPYIADDYSYATATGVLDAVRLEYTQYMTWGGRSVVHFLARIFLMLPKWVFNIANALMATWLTVVIYLLAGTKTENHSALYAFTAMGIWLYSATTGQVLLWLTGSCNYLWGCSIILTFLLPYHLYTVRGIRFKSGRWVPVAAGLGGILAGWCSENTSGGCILLVVFYLGYRKFERKPIPVWMFTGLAGTITGFLFMTLAPGNAVRSELFVDERPILRILGDRFKVCTDLLKDHFHTLLIIFAILFVVAVVTVHATKKLYFGVCYFVASLATIYALVLSPTGRNGRAVFGATVFMIIACAQLLALLDMESIRLRLGVLCLTLVMLVEFAFSAVYALLDVSYLKLQSVQRESYILEQVQAGSTDVVVPHISLPVNSKYCPLYHLDDLSEDPAFWINIHYAAAYDLESIRTADYDEWRAQHVS